MHSAARHTGAYLRAALLAESGCKRLKSMAEAVLWHFEINPELKAVHVNHVGIPCPPSHPFSWWFPTYRTSPMCIDAVLEALIPYEVTWSKWHVP